MERLVPLPLKSSVAIAYKSIRVRLFRSLITTVSLVLAVAFLCYVQASNDLAGSLLAGGEERSLAALMAAGFDIGEGANTIGDSAKQRWLIVLSLLVCVVGIVNAQLMAVTERFREIGTMKCLGALDREILKLFLLEALMQGIAGAAAGALLGLLAALAVSLFTFGSLIFIAFPLWTLLLTALRAMGIGCLLSLVGVVYPAYKAARMEPVEAMRVEQ